MLQRTPLLLLSSIDDTDGSSKYDPGGKGKSFELAMEEGFKMLGLSNAEFNQQSEGGWDMVLKGGGWPKALGIGTKINLKIRSTRWMFSSKELVGVLPWSTKKLVPAFIKHVKVSKADAQAIRAGTTTLAAMMKKYRDGSEVFLKRLARKAKQYLHKRNQVTAIRWTRPITKQVEKAIVDAVEAGDESRFLDLIADDNFETFTLKGLKAILTVSIQKNVDRLGSVTYRDPSKKGRGGVLKPFARSEKPRKFGGDLRVGFRLERAAEKTIKRVRHAFLSPQMAAKLKETTRLAPAPF